jgi:hypothetical protein
MLFAQPYARTCIVLVDECDAGGFQGAARRAAGSFGDQHSMLAYLQTDPDFAGFIVREDNAGLLKDFLYLEDCGEISFHNSFILLDPLERRQPNPGSAGSLRWLTANSTSAATNSRGGSSSMSSRWGWRSNFGSVHGPMTAGAPTDRPQT